MMSTFTLPTPPGFRFWSVVRSHGWCQLAPFTHDIESRTLERIHQFRDGAVARLVMRAGENQSIHLEIEGLSGGLTPAREAELTQALTNTFSLERDLTGFYALTRQHPRYAWIEPAAAGRMLAAPTVWEDLAKTLLTTNTTWAMTRQMNARLTALGDPYPGGGHAFPTAERLAAMNPDDLNAAVRAGYRGDYLYQLAERVANGELDVESWRDPALPSAELFKRVRALKGFGDYAAGSILKLLGHFDRLATDSACREVYIAINNGVPAASDKEISAYYEPFGEWRGLIQWMDVMEEWLRET